ncbi:MAG: acetate/propionate family kinase [Pseudomonadota bacterium]
MPDLILTLNAGSSSIKFALFAAEAEPVERLRGQVEGIGAEPRIEAKAGGQKIADRPAPEIGDHDGALAEILALIEDAEPGATVPVVGHRIVHGGTRFAEPMRLDAEVLVYLESLNPFAPLHQPHNLAGVAAAALAFPRAVQVGCFDTAFHRRQPWLADTFALPQAYYEKGVRRYGFHGLSYDFVSGAFAKVAPDRAAGRVVIAHLGNGASACAVKGGVPQGSTMGFSALDGLPMGTRIGQLDPGVMLYLMEQEGMAPAEISDLVYRQSGLKGLSGLSQDMRVLESAGTKAADQAIAYFAYRIQREIGSLTAALGGLDALVFTAGIGEHSVTVRERVCRGLGWIGLSLDAERNRAGQTEISEPGSTVGCYIMPTDEEMTIARAGLRFVGENLR